MKQLTARQRNKLLGRVCGNCASAGPTTDRRCVLCTHPKVEVPMQNQMNWYRKTKGGCAFWAPGKEANGEG